MNFTDHGALTWEKGFEPGTDSDTLVFHTLVRNTGIGIPEDRIDRLLQSLKQVDPSTKRKYGGTGLGLAISKRLVLLMDGGISVNSKGWVGTTFYFNVRLGLQEPSAQTVIGDKAPTGTSLPMMCES